MLALAHTTIIDAADEFFEDHSNEKGVATLLAGMTRDDLAISEEKTFLLKNTVRYFARELCEEGPPHSFENNIKLMICATWINSLG
jgi:hypothetical protein|tara:strand:+ start:59 stop:316 length:258 start_codon:yes stop_codon:yes gene_type:complete